MEWIEDIYSIGWKGLHWMHLACGRDKWHALVNAAGSIKCGKFFGKAAELLASEGLSSAKGPNWIMRSYKTAVGGGLVA
jgi:hypothetical protein